MQVVSWVVLTTHVAVDIFALASPIYPLMCMLYVC